MVVLLFFVLTVPCYGDTAYLLYEQWGGTWQDANKTAANTEDDLLCWAAAAANVLAWGLWGTDTYINSAQIFTHFQDHWTDNGGYSSWAYNWWIDGSPPPYYVASYPDVPGGGAFYPDLNFSDYYAYGSGANMLGTIDNLMRQGYGVAVNISNGGAMLHAITCWGFDYIYSGGEVVYQSIYVTDSDDGYYGIKKYGLSWHDDRWYITGGYLDGWRLASLMALENRDSQVPVPPSWLLLATGLLGLWSFYKGG